MTGDVIPFPNVPLAFPQTGRFGAGSNLAAMEMIGDSMSPTLRSGERVVIDTEDRSLSDGLFVLAINGTPVVYRVTQTVGSKVVLSVDNPFHGSYEVETDHLEVLVRVLWIVTRPR